MNIIPLQSGSNGNCYYVESGNTALLFDAGISVRKAQERLARYDRMLTQVDAIFVSHDHSDHTRCLGSFQRKFDLPVYITRRTLLAVQMHQKIGKLQRIRLFTAGSSQVIGSLTVHTISTPHDGADGVAFVVEDANHRVGILTDLGHPFPELMEIMPTLDGVVIESNYDEEMLLNGPYPERLKRRIQGKGGHISNHEAAILLKEHTNGRLKWACLCHLSHENNCPDVALKTHQCVVRENLPIYVAWRDRVGELLQL
jgi:phosphoribosyl 1,2-cyclic phosphodiesterase